jgi:hydroxymethylbilane synthase
MKKIIIATRGSRLAMAQTDAVKYALEAKGIAAEISEVATKGDKDRISPLSQIGGSGLFVTGIERVLLDKKADMAVHSGKDLPYIIMDGLVVAGIPKAAAPNDCLISLKGKKLPENAVIGTGSARRIAECRQFYPDAVYENIRGNVDTRLGKLRDGLYDAVILAKAGLDRLGADLSEFDVRVFEPETFIPAACQGIIAAECRSDDMEMIEILKSISDETAFRRFKAERYMFGLMQTDCSAALGVYSQINGDILNITAMFNGRKASRTGMYKDYKILCSEIKEEIYG